MYRKLHQAKNLDKAVKQLEKHRILNRESKRNRIRGPQVNRAKSRELTERPLPTRHSSETNSIADSITDEQDSEENVPLNSGDLEISFEHLKVFEDTERVIKTGKKKKPKKSKTKKLQEKEDERKKELIEILCAGKVIKLKELLDNVGKDIEGEQLNIVDDLRQNFLNEVLDEEGNSMMHIAAMNEHVDLLRFLLENNSDPCLRNKKLQTPYSCTCSKKVRDAMKEFAKENPEKHNYNKAQIPLNSLTEDELAEKKKQQRKIKREKEKIKKEENKTKKIEENERQRFLKLSDREKRALAAERRILVQNGAVTARCFLCATDITGKVPFEYLNNRFCSMDCLKAHRLQNPIL